MSLSGRRFLTPSGRWNSAPPIRTRGQRRSGSQCANSVDIGAHLESNFEETEGLRSSGSFLRMLADHRTGSPIGRSTSFARIAISIDGTKDGLKIGKRRSGGSPQATRNSNGIVRAIVEF